MRLDKVSASLSWTRLSAKISTLNWWKKLRLFLLFALTTFRPLWNWHPKGYIGWRVFSVDLKMSVWIVLHWYESAPSSYKPFMKIFRHVKKFNLASTSSVWQKPTTVFDTQVCNRLENFYVDVFQEFDDFAQVRPHSIFSMIILGLLEANFTNSLCSGRNVLQCLLPTCSILIHC